MKHKVFIPITDELLYDYPHLITAPLRPYQADSPCYHWMATIESCDKNGQHPLAPVRYFDHRMWSRKSTPKFKRFQDSHDSRPAI